MTHVVESGSAGTLHQGAGQVGGAVEHLFAGLAHLTDVKSLVMPGTSITVAGDVITLPVLKDLSRGELYRVRVTFTSGGSIRSAWFDVLAQL